MKEIPTQNYPQLEVQDAPETRAYDTICTIVRNDPVLRRIVNTFIDYSGTTLDAVDPSLALMPWLRFTPVPIPSEFESESQVRGDFYIQTELAIVGTNVRNLLNFYGAIRSAIKYSTNSIAYNAAGIVIPLFYLPALQFRKEDDSGNRYIYSAGAISIRMRIDF